MSASEVIGIYRGRDNSEKMFRTQKSAIDVNKFRVHSDTLLQSKVFITFIAIIIRDEMSRNIEITRNNQGRYTKRYALSAKRKLILKQFGIDEKYIEHESSGINSKLVK